MDNVTVTYKTADGQRICVEVSTPVKELLEQSDRQIRTQRRQDRRHLNFTVCVDDESVTSHIPTVEDTADLFERMERDGLLYRAIEQLTEKQQTRLRRHFFEGLSYRQIARIESVNHRTVIESVEQALKQLRKLCQQ